MRPIISLAYVVGALMLGYAAGVLATPYTGAMGWLNANTFLNAPMMAAAFAGCGTYILVANPPAPLFSLLTLPILFYAGASTLYFLGSPAAALTAVLGHIGLWLVINVALIERARAGAPKPSRRN